MAKSAPPRSVSIRLTQSQRRLMSELVPGLAGRLSLDARNERTIQLSLADMQVIEAAAAAALPNVSAASKRRLLGLVLEKLQAASDEATQAKKAAAKGTVYRFKITLRGTKPPIWRRIETLDCTFDQLHQHIQTVMGWTNSHLHQFVIGGEFIGDPAMLGDEFMPFDGLNSRRTRLSRLLPADGQRVRFRYDYDFGDDWEHEVLLERVSRPDPAMRYPICLAGARRCPPEDVGGVWGYASFLEAMRDPTHERHDDYVDWWGDAGFDAEHFDADEATLRMHGGLPDCRDW